MTKLPRPKEISATSRTTAPRQSNFEALRMLAMFLVLVVHAMYGSLGSPGVEEIAAAPADTGLRMLLRSLAVVCVDVFVLISGWFGIRPKWKSAANFLFQIFFFMAGIYITALIFGFDTFSIRKIGTICLAERWSYWFIKAYLVLYIISPALNAFVEKASRKELGLTLVFFYLFQTLYGFATPGGLRFFAAGYSPVSFIGLYLLAGYVRRYRPRWSAFSPRTDLVIYVLPPLLYTAIGLLRPYFAPDSGIGKPITYAWELYMHYTNPLVITGALYLLLFFSKLNFTSRFVNLCGASCFAVYLLHTHISLRETYYQGICGYLHDHFPLPAYLALTFAFLAAVFFAAIAIDQVRIAAWRPLWRWIEPRIPQSLRC